MNIFNRQSLQIVRCAQNILSKFHTSGTLQEIPKSVIPTLEPRFLNDPEPRIGKHDKINVMIYGYDSAVLQSYQSWVHSKAVQLGLNVVDAFATPCKNLEVTKIKEGVLEEKYHLNYYQRSIKIQQMPEPILPIFTEVIQAGLPEGVKVNLDYFDDEHENVRYIPDYKLLELRQELADVDKVEDPKQKNKYRKKK